MFIVMVFNYSVAFMMPVLSREEAKRLNAEQFDCKDADSMVKALGNASKVIVAIGTGEDGGTPH